MSCDVSASKLAITQPERMLQLSRSPRKVRLLFQCLAGSACLVVFGYFGFVFHVGLTTISFAYLLVVFGMALFCGFWQASFISLLSVVCLDYFFTEPLFRFDIANPQDWVALGTFELTSLVISRLSAKELRSAREAALHRTGMEQLYELSRCSLLLDLHQPPGPQLAVLIQRIFQTQAVALFDVNLERQDRTGEWEEDQQDIAKQCYLDEISTDDLSTQTSRRVLLAGQYPVGALVVRGKLQAVIVDALASLSAMAIDRYQSFEKEERAENASRSEQLRAAVMDGLAHDFKTPLSAVQTASSGLLEQAGLNDLQTEMVSLINHEIARMNELCTRLLLTAKLDAGKVGLEKAEVNVLELIRELTADSDVNKNRVVVTVDDPTLTVRVDRSLLAMILTQYLDNARKYSTTPETPIEVVARKSYSEVLFSVHNVGPTIPLEDRERIFDRFYRSPEHSASAPGTGIGLSVVRKAAAAHHGHVWVISGKNEGTTFFLSLPISSRGTQ
jgi:two-component system, OmpR family, sensor histidine kinase KdpD